MSYQVAKVDACAQVIQLSGKPRSFQLDGKTTLVFGISGSIEGSLYPGEKRFKVEGKGAVKIDQEPAQGESMESGDRVLVILDPKKEDGSIILVEIF